jgi:hypothetical protein
MGLGIASTLRRQRLKIGSLILLPRLITDLVWI